MPSSGALATCSGNGRVTVHVVVVEGCDGGDGGHVVGSETGLGSELDGGAFRGRSYSAADHNDRTRKPSTSCLATAESRQRLRSSVANNKLRVADPPTQALRAGLYSCEHIAVDRMTAKTTQQAPECPNRSRRCEPVTIPECPVAMVSNGALQESRPNMTNNIVLCV